ncbi:MAG: hypothetical protein ACRYFU_12010 [Janthinobacterium lividum]
MTGSKDNAELEVWTTAIERWRTGILEKADQIRRTRLLISAKAIDTVLAETTIRILKLEMDEMYGPMIARAEVEIARLSR